MRLFLSLHACGRSLIANQTVIGRKCQKIDEFIAQRQISDQLLRFTPASSPCRVRVVFAPDKARHLLVQALTNEAFCDLVPAIEHASWMMDPLPELRSRNLGGCGVFHQVIEWHGDSASTGSGDGVF